MQLPKLITGPVIEPVTLAEAKAQCRVDISDDDTLITTLIGDAREYCERIDWRAYLTQTYDLYLDEFPASGEIRFPRPPLQSVTSVKYTDENGVVATLASSTYIVDTISEPARLVLKSNQSWPTVTLQQVNGVVVRFVAGWTQASDVPRSIKRAMLLLIGHWYENREETTVGAVSRSIEFGVRALLGVDSAKRF